MALIRLDGVSFKYEDDVLEESALSNINFEVNEGEFVSAFIYLRKW